MRSSIAILLFTIILCACEQENDPCDMPINGENYILSDSSKAFVSNYNEANRIIFKTLNGNEIAFDVVMIDTVASYQVSVPCEFDSLQGQLIKGNSQSLTYTLINDLIVSESVSINVLEFPEIPSRQAQESIIISIGKYLSNAFEEGDLLFDYNLGISNPQLNFLDSFIIADKTYYSVYEPNYGGYTPKLEVKYTKEEGLIYIKDPQSSMEYVYDRKE